MKIASLPVRRLFTRKRLVWTTLGLVTLALLGFLFLRPPPKPELVTAQARQGPIEEVVLAAGVLEPLELVRVGAQASGRVERLAVKVGDRVEVGQLIAEIDSQIGICISP